MKSQNKNKGLNVCWCNMVTKEVIEAAIESGSIDIYEIFEKTNAGVGACGGTCRPYIQNMIEEYIKTGKFPVKPR